ncbi:MAG: tail fiber domain-containing protein [Flavobacterium sp.]
MVTTNVIKAQGGITGSTGSFRDLVTTDVIKAQGGITGPTGSFTYLTVSQQLVSSGNIIGLTGYFQNITINDNVDILGDITSNTCYLTNLYTSDNSYLATDSNKSVVIGKSSYTPYDISYTSQDISGSTTISSSNGYSSVFPDSKMLIYGTRDTTSFTKTFYIQDISNPSTYINMDLTNLITGASSYSSIVTADVSGIYICQIYPVYYTSSTNCKFFIRLELNLASNNIYIITCNGDPSDMNSYSYSPNYLTTGNTIATPPNSFDNGISCLVNGVIPTTNNAIPPISNASPCGRQRMSINMYDSVNDLLVLGSQAGSTTQSYTVVNSSLTQCARYDYYIPTDFSSTTLNFISSTYNSNCVAKLYNNNSNSKGKLQIAYWDKTTYSMNISNYLDVTLDLSNGSYRNSTTITPYIIELNNLIYVYVPWYSGTSSYTLNIALFTWDKQISNNPSFVFTKLIESVGTNVSNNQTNQYVGLVTDNTTNIEIFSTYSKNYYTSNDGLTTLTTYPQTNYSSGYSAFMCSGYSTGQGGAFRINYPFISILRGSSTSAFNNLTNFYNNVYSLDVSGSMIISGEALVLGGITGGTGSFSYLNASQLISASSGITGSTGSFQDLVTANVIKAQGGITGTTGSFTYLSASQEISAPIGITGSTGSFRDLVTTDVIKAQGGITGPTGSFQDLVTANVIKAQGGITGTTGSFTYLSASQEIFAPIGITGSTGSFQDLVTANVIKAQGGIVGATGTFSYITDVSSIDAYYMYLTSGTNYNTSSNAVMPKSYIDSIGSGLKPSQACYCATTANIDLTSVDAPTPNSMDGIDFSTLSDGSYNILVINQGLVGMDVSSQTFTTNVQNGVYILNKNELGAYTWSRPSIGPMSLGSDALGCFSFVTNGALYGGNAYVQIYGLKDMSGNNIAIVGTDALQYTLLYQVKLQIGQGLLLNDGTLSVDPSLNFISHLDNISGQLNIGQSASSIQIGSTSSSSPTHIFNGITGPTGSFRDLVTSNVIKAQGGITGSTGSFRDLVTTDVIKAQGGITGPTGSFRDLVTANVIKAHGGITGTTGSFTYLSASQEIFAPIGITGSTGSFRDLVTTDVIKAQGGITGPTGSFQDLVTANVIKAQGGITGTTGSFTYLSASQEIFAPIGITGSTGSFQDLVTANVIKAQGGITGSTGSFSYITASSELDILNYSTNASIRLASDNNYNYFESGQYTPGSTSSKPLIFSPYYIGTPTMYLDISNCKVAVNKLFPSYTLDVNGDIYASNAIQSQNLKLYGNSSNAYIQTTNSDSTLYLGTSNRNNMLIGNDGCVYSNQFRTNLDANIGYSVLNKGDASTTGFVGFYDASNTQLGYIGAGSFSGNLQMSSNNGWLISSGSGSTTLDSVSITTGLTVNGVNGFVCTGPSSLKSQGYFQYNSNYDCSTILSADDTTTEIKMNNAGSTSHFTISNKSNSFQINNTTASILPFTAGTNCLTISSTNNIGIGKSPTYTLDVSGNINFSGMLTQNGQPYLSSSQWTTSTGGIYYNSGNVSIGKSTISSYALDVSGTIFTNSYITSRNLQMIGDASNAYVRTTNSDATLYMGVDGTDTIITSGLGTQIQNTYNADLDAYYTLSIQNSTSDDQIGFIPYSKESWYNNITQDGDKLIVGDGLYNKESITLTTHSSTTCGLRVTSNSILMGAGGTSSTPSYYFQSDPSNNINKIQGNTNITGNTTGNVTTIQSTYDSNTPRFTLYTNDTSSQQGIGFVPYSEAGWYNNIVQLGDQSIVGFGTYNAESIVLTSDSNTKTGIRITPTTALIGSGGSGETGEVGNPICFFQSDGNLLKNTINGNTTINGTATIDGITTIYANTTIYGTVFANAFNATSDVRIKTNIQPLDDAYSVDRLNPVSYTNKLTEKPDIGFIAHEVQEVFPSLVTGEKGADAYQTINYNGIIPILVKEIQRLKERIEALETAKV